MLSELHSGNGEFLEMLRVTFLCWSVFGWLFQGVGDNRMSTKMTGIQFKAWKKSSRVHGVEREPPILPTDKLWSKWTSWASMGRVTFLLAGGFLLKHFLMFTPIHWGNDPIWRAHIFQTGLDCLDYTNYS